MVSRGAGGSARDLLGGIVGLTVIAAATSWAAESPAPPLRHLYLLPILWGAVRFGQLGGLLAGLLAVLLYSPLVLPAVEQEGLTEETLDGLVTFGIFLGIGALAGALAQRARAQAERYNTLLALQRILGSGDEIEPTLAAVTTELRSALGAREVALMLFSEGEPLLVVRRAGAPPARPGQGEGFCDESAARWVVREGRSLFIADPETDPRLGPPPPGSRSPGVRRLFLVPLRARDDCIGVMAVEREGEFPRSDRTAVETLGLQLALGIENARLAARQRRFAQELEEKVAAATRSLRELDQAKTDFLSIVSHELKTPLTAVQGFSELLLTRPILPDRARQFLGYIHQEAERLGRIVADLLDLSRIELGRGVELHRSPVALGPLLQANGELFQAQTSRHRLIWEASPDLPLALADRDATDQVIKNLLSNALKYSPEGGVVRLWAARSGREPGMVEIGVSDQGVGIPAEALLRVFEKYYRVSHPATVRARGLGIGLALAKHLIEAQGGRIWAESQEGRGSRFVATLPIAAEPLRPALGSDR